MTTTWLPVTGPVPLRITASVPTPGSSLIVVAGYIDLSTAPILGMRLLTIMHDQHPAVVQLDLAEVTFLDCAGIGVLVAVRNLALRVGCQLRVAHPQGLVTRVLEVTGLLSVLTAPLRPHDPTPPPAESLTIPRHGRAGSVVQTTATARAA